MHVNIFNEDNAHMHNQSYTTPRQKPTKKYGFFKFMFDSIMVTLTGGLWLIWIFVREMRKN